MTQVKRIAARLIPYAYRLRKHEVTSGTVFYLLTFLWCIPSPLILVMNAEAWVIANALIGPTNPLLLGLSAGLGQTIGFTVIFYAGERLVRLFPRLDGRLQRFDAKRYETVSYAALGLGSVTGFPPTILLTLATRAIGYRFRYFLPIIIVGRCTRFLLLSYLPQTFQRLFSGT